MAQVWFRSRALTTARLEAFSDGVLAVALTLLALDLKLPADLGGDTEIWKAVVRLGPAFGAWLVSFAYVLTLWVNHHYLFDGVKAVDRGLLWLNGFFLLSVTLVPFPTNLVGEYPGKSAPLALLSGVMFFCSLSFTLMRLYLRGRDDLAKHTVAERNIGLARSAVGPLMYAFAFALSFLAPAGAIACQVAALVVFIAAPPNFGRKAQ